MPRPQIVLPPTYYHDHFTEMLAFLGDVYGLSLDEAERGFMAAFARLSLPAQCLFIRMSNRRKGVFRLSDLTYAEIPEPGDALAELHAAGFARSVDEGDYQALLNGMSKPGLVALAKAQALDGFRAGWGKSAIIDWIAERLGFDDFAQTVDVSACFMPEHRETVAFLLYLYFGKLSDGYGDNMTSFALRDLGLLSVKARENYQARFEDMDEARAGFVYSRLRRELARKGDVERIAAAIDTFPQARGDFTQRLRDKVLHAIGQHFEKSGDTARAIDVYDRATLFEARERSVRLLHARGDMEAVKTRLDAMLETPNHDEEYIFASDFYQRKFGARRTGIYTELLRGAEILTADDVYRGHPEYAAIRHFEREGYQAFHTENGLWPALFGLLFWDELFEGGALSSGFDRVPQSLRDRTFHLKFAAVIDAKLSAVAMGEAEAMIGATAYHHFGEDNGLFMWSEGLGAMLRAFLRTAPPAAVRDVLRHMTQDVYALRDGFPDLLLIGADHVRFVEIKAEGDVIRRHQLARLNLLNAVGFKADICRVRYAVDPDQTYVVVDVETTGGRPPLDRVTEIGAVKVRGGRIVDEWSSLINPQRHIPAMITQLTGITNAMVAEAPLFADVADAFEAFMAGSVFVAHNVNFDHGFIASEYRRLEKPFRYPKLCTCASMRRLYPGHDSYGLAALSRAYNIRLDNHHRALADARATAELLLMVNEKRLQAA
ncbi:MAG: exonuclease domain-containing protein [Asticcacaulis sp.]